MDDRRKRQEFGRFGAIRHEPSKEPTLAGIEGYRAYLRAKKEGWDY